MSISASSLGVKVRAEPPALSNRVEHCRSPRRDRVCWSSSLPLPRASVVAVLFQFGDLQETLSVAKKLKGVTPASEVVERCRRYAWTTSLPRLVVHGTVERSLRYTNEQSHQGDAFMRTYGEVLDLIAALERFPQADSCGRAFSRQSESKRQS